MDTQNDTHYEIIGVYPCLSSANPCSILRLDSLEIRASKLFYGHLGKYSLMYVTRIYLIDP